MVLVLRLSWQTLGWPERGSRQAYERPQEQGARDSFLAVITSHNLQCYPVNRTRVNA